MNNIRSISIMLVYLQLSVADMGSWTCGSDGYWYENGVRSTYSGCAGGKDGTSSGGESGGTSSDDKALTCVNGVYVDAQGAATTYPCGLDATNDYISGKSGETGNSGGKDDGNSGGGGKDDGNFEGGGSKGGNSGSGGKNEGNSGGNPRHGDNSGESDASYGWTCANSVWTDPKGAATPYPCEAGEDIKTPAFGNKDQGGKNQGGCTVTEMRSNVMAGLDRTCISHPSYIEGRCWWTYVPNAVATATDGRKVPLLVDMHGGGGCASDQFLSSGFKDLSDTEAATGGGMILVWPQGGLGGLWVSHGTSDRATPEATAGKSLPEWDDIGFLEQLIANMVRNSTHSEKINPGRIYLSGFSQGCMMANRFSMERSKLVAAFGCHGGELSLFPTTQTEMDTDMSNYTIGAMPAYLTIGDADPWFPGTNSSWYAWKYWNECSSTFENTSTTGFVEHIASSCKGYSPALQTVMLVIAGGAHAPDTSASEKQWRFMSQYTRTGVMTELPLAVNSSSGPLTSSTPAHNLAPSPAKNPAPASPPAQNIAPNSTSNSTSPAPAPAPVAAPSQPSTGTASHASERCKKVAVRSVLLMACLTFMRVLML